MPRSIDIVLRDEIVDMVTPGEVCLFTGTLIVVPDLVSLIKPGDKSQISSRTLGAQKKNNSVGMDGVTGLK